MAEEDIKGIPLSKNQQMLKLLMVDKLQYPAQKIRVTCRKLRINQVITEHILTTSVVKTKPMAFKGREPVGSKIVR
jgi:hypothetical protein